MRSELGEWSVTPTTITLLPSWFEPVLCSLSGMQCFCKQCEHISLLFLSSGKSRPSDKGGLMASHPNPEIRGGGLKKKFFGPSGLSLVFKKSPPLDQPLLSTAFRSQGLLRESYLWKAWRDFFTYSSIHNAMCPVAVMTILLINYHRVDLL